MKLPQSTIHTEAEGQIKEYDFSVNVEDTGIIFDMLRSKIYKKPIDSICREIASNARDANREVGHNDIPIEIIIRDNKGQELINNSSLSIEFKDNGPGISPDRMGNVFCKYAASTKRYSNYMTGGFGLGAKTPFSYTDIFNVITVVDKIKYYYTAYIDESKRGKIILLNQEETQELNGTSIIIPINPNDRNTFEKKCIEYTSLWECQPKYSGFNIIIPKLSYYNDISKSNKYNIAQVNSNSNAIGNNKQTFEKTTIISIDGIPYPYDNELAEYKNIPEHYNNNIQNTLILYFDNGVLDISVNRENLQYTDKTNKILRDRFTYIKNIFKEEFNTEIKKATNYIHACAIYSSIINGQGVDLFSENKDSNFLHYMKTWLQQNKLFTDFFYNNQKLEVSFKYNKFTSTQIFRKDKNIKVENIENKNSLNEVGFYDARIWNSLPCYLLDSSKRNIKRDLSIIKNNENGFILIKELFYKPPKWMIKDEIAIKAKTIEFENEKLIELNNIKKIFNVINYKDVIPLKITLAKDENGIKLPIITHFPAKYVVFDFSKYRCDTDDKWKSIDFTYNKTTNLFDAKWNYQFLADKDTYYVAVDKLSDFKLNAELHLKLKILHNYKQFNLLAINKKNITKIENKKIGNSIITSAEELIKDKKNVDLINEYLENSYLFELYEDLIVSQHYDKLNFGDTEIGKVITDITTKILALKKSNSKIYNSLNKYVVNYFISNLSYKFDKNIEISIDKIKNINKTYKLIPLFQTYRIENYINEINEYIKLVNKDNKEKIESLTLKIT